MTAKGRPKIEIDKRMFEELCKLQCTRDEICSVLNVTDKTLTRWCQETYNSSFSVVFRQKRENGKASLRRMQWKLAEKSPAMAIFLGKQFLDQSEHQNVEVTQKVLPTIKVTIPVEGD